jgi:four helix bundle protein
MTEIRSNYDLEKRTIKFGENIIKFAKTLPKNIITVSIIIQLVKSGTNIRANYCEAIGVSSKKRF